MKDPLDILDKIEKAEAPPFLFTRIMQGIEQRRERINPRTALAMALCVLILFIINIRIISGTSNSTSPAQSISQSMHLDTSNYLYR